MSRFLFMLLGAVVILSAGCQSAQSEAAQKEKDAIGKKITDARNPRMAVAKMREYVLEKMDDLTEAEEKVITSTEPKIACNYDQTEYSFVWKVDNHKAHVEVLATPAPFIPLGAYRVSRTYYP